MMQNMHKNANIKKIKNDMNLKFDNIMWGEMSRRNIFIDVVVPSYCGTKQFIKERMIVHLKEKCKCIIFTNIREDAISNLVPFCNEIIAEMNIENSIDQNQDLNEEPNKDPNNDPNYDPNCNPNDEANDLPISFLMKI